MPSIEFSIDHATGDTSLKINGLRGRKACQPIHDAFSADLAKLGLGELTAELTNEGKLPPVTVTRQTVATAFR